MTVLPSGAVNLVNQLSFKLVLSQAVTSTSPSNTHPATPLQLMLQATGFIKDLELIALPPQQCPVPLPSALIPLRQ